LAETGEGSARPDEPLLCVIGWRNASRFKTMTKQSFAAAVVLLLLIMLGMEIGAGLYEARVVVPTWTQDPQAAFKFWKPNPEFALSPGPRWWMFTTPFTGLLGLCTLLLAGSFEAERRTLLRMGSGLVVLLTIGTFVYFVPNLLFLQGSKVLTLDPAEARAQAALWSKLNWVRAAGYVAAWLAIIRAVSLNVKVR